MLSVVRKVHLVRSFDGVLFEFRRERPCIELDFPTRTRNTWMRLIPARLFTMEDGECMASKRAGLQTPMTQIVIAVVHGIRSSLVSPLVMWDERYI